MTIADLFGLTHSTLRVMVERTFDALNNRFTFLGQKAFNHFPPKISLFLHVAFFITGP
jgi:hypothetical protein